MKYKNQILSCAFIVQLIGCISANAAGDLDLSFGTSGTGTVQTLIIHSVGVYGSAQAYASVVQPDDKIIAVGSVTYGQNSDVALVRYNSDGTLDTSFGNFGQMVVRVNTSSNEEAFAVALQPDGKIIVGGYAVVTYPYSGTRRYFALWRFNSDGTKDYSFGSAGKTLIEGNQSEYQKSGATIRALVVQPDGKIVAVGYARLPDYAQAIIRYHPNGAVDTSFSGGTNSVKYLNYNSYAFAAAQQSDGEIVIGGYTLFDAYYRKFDFTAVRFNSPYSSAGTVDSITLTHFFDYADDRAYAVAVQPDDKFVLAGNTASSSPNYSDYALARYNADGTLDENFGYIGRVTMDFASGADQANSVMVQPDGKIVAAGFSVANSKNYFSLARFDENGNPDFGFGVFGQVTTDFPYGASANSIITQSDGKIIAVGNTHSPYNLFALARYEN